MKKYTANYALTSPNFVIQNLRENEIEEQDKALLYVLKNLFQRGVPTTLSQYLQDKLGEIHLEDDFKEEFLFISTQPPTWVDTIKGDNENNYFPAKEFFENIIPNEFGEFSFIQSLLLPEIEINKIVGKDNTEFTNQQVDFYLPLAKLIIEIDGRQHEIDDVILIGDIKRDKYLHSNGFKVIRITTDELRNGHYKSKITDILNYFKTEEISKKLRSYKTSFNLIKNNNLSQKVINRKILPSAIIRFQLLLIDFLLNKYLAFGNEWNFNIIIRDSEKLEGFAELAIDDFFIWYSKLHKLKTKEDFNKPKYNINYVYSLNQFDTSSNVIDIDFSLFERWTDENRLHPNLIIVRSDYFGIEKNYFRVSCTKSIKYKITEADKPVLEFFLKNIFGKEKVSFRDGQFPIISNVLNGEDTIGLLPTGGGKSICYQLPCLLQPSVSFVVCPIKSLMYDQELNMKKAHITNISAITSDTKNKVKVQNEFAQGKHLFIWISPERFQIKKFRNYIAHVYANLSISYAVIDEVHCMSEWGHDFRTSYLNLTRTIQKHCPSSTFIGLTATASINVLTNIKVEFSRNNRKLGNENVKSLLDYSRKELEFDIILSGDNKYKKLEKIIHEEAILEDDTNNACLIFTPHVNGHYGCHSLANNIDRLSKGKTKWYSGEVPKIPEYDKKGKKTGRKIPVMNSDAFNKHKKDVQEGFQNSDFPILVATKAFGMGIDKKNINYTFHYGIPGSIEALYQEAGRAGRWNDKSKKAKCYVLYSQEITEKENLNKLFEIGTTFSEIKAIGKEVGREGKDIFRNVFLFLQGQRDINIDYKAIDLIINNYFKANSIRKIWFSTISKELKKIGFTGSNEELKEVAQKAIYKLRLLGVVSDWTTDFKNHFEVEFNTIEEESVFASLKSFIANYKADFDLKKEFKKIKRGTILQKSIWYLLKWTFENIAYSRKQSLKTLADWCDKFEEEGNLKFKQRIDSYFRFTDTTFILQHIGENPKDFQKWFDVFYLEQENEAKEKISIYIPEIKNNIIEFERLRDSLSRFLIDYQDNVGFNLISGLIRLSLNDFEDEDGKSRFESGLLYIKESFSELEQEKIILELKKYGNSLSEENKENLCFSIIKYYPNSLEEFADYYGLFYLLDDTISKKVNQLKALNTKLYEEFKQIGTI